MCGEGCQYRTREKKEGKIIIRMFLIILAMFSIYLKFFLQMQCPPLIEVMILGLTMLYSITTYNLKIIIQAARSRKFILNCWLGKSKKLTKQYRLFPLPCFVSCTFNIILYCWRYHVLCIQDSEYLTQKPPHGGLEFIVQKVAIETTRKKKNHESS